MQNRSNSHNGDSVEQKKSTVWRAEDPHRNGSRRSDAPWKNTNVLFCHSELDDAEIPYRAFRILFHLRRRIGTSSHAATGIRGIAKVCRMKTATVQDEIDWLERKHWITIVRGGGGRKANRYGLNLNSKCLYLDHRLDDHGLSPTEFRVLAHISRLADTDDGHFFISPNKFAVICGMKWETIGTVRASLEEKEFYIAYDDRKNPMYHLYLDELFPRSPEKVRQT